MITTFLGLTLPTVLDPTGFPAWANSLNGDMNIIDLHDHTTGRGKKIPVAGLNINANIDLSGSYRLLNSLSLKMLNNSAIISGDTTSLQAVNGNLCYVNASGTNIQITAGSGLNLSSSGTIGGDYGGTNPASVFYTDAVKTFFFTKSSGITAGVAHSNLFIYEMISGGKYVQIKTSTGLTANYDVTLPPALPSDTKVVTMDSSGVLAVTTALAALPPIGTIIPFYDYNGALTFDANYWAYCNGQNKVIAGIGAQTLPDLSNRYPVGFGTEAGGNNGSAAWSITPVGNANHQVDLSHQHGGLNHYHSLGAHTHLDPTHNHRWKYYDGNATNAQTWNSTNGLITCNYRDMAGGSTEWMLSRGFSAAIGGLQSYFTDVSGGTYTGGPTTDSGYSNPTTNSQLSTTQSIQVRSVQVRWLMRIA